MKTSKPKTKAMVKRRNYLLIIAALIVTISVVLALVVPEYQKRQAQASAIAAEKEQKLEQLRSLELKLSTMQGKVNYTDSEEYLLRYAREYLGYMLPGDIRIDINDPDAPIPTAQLPLVTARPTVVPNETLEPSPTDGIAASPEPGSTDEPNTSPEPSSTPDPGAVPNG